MYSSHVLILHSSHFLCGFDLFRESQAWASNNISCQLLSWIQKSHHRHHYSLDTSFFLRSSLFHPERRRHRQPSESSISCFLVSCTLPRINLQTQSQQNLFIPQHGWMVCAALLLYWSMSTTSPTRPTMSILHGRTMANEAFSVCH